MEPTFALLGQPSIDLDMAAKEYAGWLEWYDSGAGARPLWSES
jgi:hypothetical protein